MLKLLGEACWMRAMAPRSELVKIKYGFIARKIPHPPSASSLFIFYVSPLGCAYLAFYFLLSWTGHKGISQNPRTDGHGCRLLARVIGYWILLVRKIR